jgi:hypothetical protein
MLRHDSNPADRERFQRVADLFDQALERQGRDREAFLARECEKDPTLRAELLSLLHVYSEEDDPRVDFPFLRGRPGDLPEAMRARINNFRLERCLGVGGMGIVYLAQQEGSVQRTVALKLIKLGMDTDEVLTRFAREQHTLASLSHNGIARVYETGTSEDGPPYFAMEPVSNGKSQPKPS